jgi:hypothetical protein
MFNIFKSHRSGYSPLEDMDEAEDQASAGAEKAAQTDKAAKLSLDQKAALRELEKPWNFFMTALEVMNTLDQWHTRGGTTEEWKEIRSSVEKAALCGVASTQEWREYLLKTQREVAAMNGSWQAMSALSGHWLDQFDWNLTAPLVDPQLDRILQICLGRARLHLNSAYNFFETQQPSREKHAENGRKLLEVAAAVVRCNKQGTDDHKKQLVEVLTAMPSDANVERMHQLTTQVMGPLGNWMPPQAGEASPAAEDTIARVSNGQDFQRLVREFKDQPLPKDVRPAVLAHLQSTLALLSKHGPSGRDSLQPQDVDALRYAKRILDQTKALTLGAKDCYDASIRLRDKVTRLPHLGTALGAREMDVDQLRRKANRLGDEGDLDGAVRALNQATELALATLHQIEQVKRKQWDSIVQQAYSWGMLQQQLHPYRTKQDHMGFRIRALERFDQHAHDFKLAKSQAQAQACLSSMRAQVSSLTQFYRQREAGRASAPVASATASTTATAAATLPPAAVMQGLPDRR